MLAALQAPSAFTVCPPPCILSPDMGTVGFTKPGLKHACVIAVSPVMPPAVVHCPVTADIGAVRVVAVDVHTHPVVSAFPHTRGPPAAEKVTLTMLPALEHTRMLRI